MPCNECDGSTDNTCDVLPSESVCSVFLSPPPRPRSRLPPSPPPLLVSLRCAPSPVRSFGLKLTCRYFRTRTYFEVDIDIGSSVVAYNTVSLAIGYAKGLVVDMGFCVQVHC